MFMRFDDVKHWVPIYRERFRDEDSPPLQWRICTQFAPAGALIPNDVPVSKMYPPGLMWKLFSSKLAMIFGR